VLQNWLQSGRSIEDRVSTRREAMSSFPAECLPRGAWRERPGYNPDNAVSVPIAPMETVLNSTKFSINTSYANMARQLDLCSIADSAREIGVVPATYNPYDPTTWDMPIDEMYGTELAPSVVVLGELRISALDMAAAYATWAANGTFCKPQGISEVVDRNGDSMEISGADCHQAVDPEIADTMAWVLQQDLEDPRATGKGKVVEGHPAGGKTGTSGSQFHTWYVGFTRQMSTAVWFGHPQSNIRPGGFSVDGEMLSRGHVWGNTVSLPTWQEYMTDVHKDLPSKAFPAAPKPTSTAAGDAIEKGTVPDVGGMPIEQARAAVEAAGYKVEIEEAHSDDIGPDSAIDTDPPAGTELPQGQTVVIRESSSDE
jgi:membrane peptidoglycan carboxypeptidase